MAGLILGAKGTFMYPRTLPTGPPQVPIGSQTLYEGSGKPFPSRPLFVGGGVAKRGRSGFVSITESTPWFEAMLNLARTQ